MIFLLMFVSSAVVAEPYVISPEQKNHWAWKPVSNVTVPAVKDAAWAKGPLDCLILARLEAANVPLAPAASREQLIRRVSIDLIGLPPTPAEIDQFLRDQSPKAWEKVIDRLL